MELPLSMVSKLAFWYLYLPDYRVSTNYLHMTVPIGGGGGFDERRDKELLKRLYNIYN